MPAYLIHVKPSATGAWVVQPQDRATPLSEHASETAAERAAVAHAAGRDDPHVVVHDRYGRVHFVPATRPRRARMRASLDA